MERSRITVEEVKPLLHEEVQFQNRNCTIDFDDDEDEEEEEFVLPFSAQQSEDSSKHRPSQSIIRTSEMSPGEIFSTILDKYDSKSGGYL